MIFTIVSLLEIIQELLQRPDHAKENMKSLMKAEKKNQICILETLFQQQCKVLKQNIINSNNSAVIYHNYRTKAWTKEVESRDREEGRKEKYRDKTFC